jgi:hypothetical protein
MFGREDLSMRMNRLAVAYAFGLIAAASVALVPPAQAATSGRGPVHLYVASDGNDAHPGTRARPFATLHRAQRAVRRLPDRMRREVVVTLADGIYRLKRPLKLTALDSGRDGHAVLWRAAPGAKPVLSGGRRIRGWRLYDADRGIYRAPAPGLRTRQLYVDGRRATRARASVTRSEFTKTSTGYDAYGAAGEMLGGLAHPSDTEVQSNVEWMGYRCGISGVGREGSSLGSTASASSVDPAWPDFVPRNAFDGDPATFWQSGETPSEPDWVQVRLGTRVEIGRIVVRSRRFPQMVLQDLEVATSVGDEPLVTSGSVRDNQQAGADFPIALDPPVTADRVRVTVSRESYAGQDRPWADLAEVELYAPDGSEIDVRPSRTAVTMDQPCFRNANLRYNEGWNIGAPTTVENAHEFLDEPGEWYLDERSGWLFYAPHPDEHFPNVDVVAPVLETLVSGSGTAAAPVHDIRFEGLTFADATWREPSTAEGYAVDQTGFRFTGTENPKNWGHGERTMRTPGNMSFSFARRITFERNRFTRLGAVALDFDTGSQENSILGNRFDDVSAAAVQIGGVDVEDHHPSDPRQLTRDNRIADNVITRVGQEYYDAPGIYVGYTARTTVEHNELTDLPYSGITVGWGWGSSDPGGTHKWDSFVQPPAPNAGWTVHSTPTTSTGNRVIANRIDDYLNVLRDGGAIYILGWQGTSMDDGMTLDGNVATNQRAPFFTFYTDAGSRFVTMRRNVGATAIPAWGGCAPHGDLLYEGNYWKVAGPPNASVCGTTGPGDAPTNVVFRGNTVIGGLADAPDEIVNAAGPRLISERK